LLQKACGTFNRSFVMTHSNHKEVDILLIYFGVIFHETNHHVQAHVTSGTLMHCPFLHREKNTNSNTFGLMILLAGVCYDDSWITKHFFCLNWSEGGRSWLLTASSIKFLARRSPKSRWVYLVPHEDNSIQLLSMLTTTTVCLIYFPLYDWRSFRNMLPVRCEHLLQWWQNRSKATMWLLYKIPAIQGCLRCF